MVEKMMVINCTADVAVRPKTKGYGEADQRGDAKGADAKEVYGRCKSSFKI